jgi:hypothetical protein
MIGSGKLRRSSTRGRALAVGVVGLLAPLLGAGAVTTAAASASAAGVRPNAVGNLDCNGHSAIQKPVSLKQLCTDIRGFPAGNDSWGGRFYDNGHYIGHDEPSLRFLSNRPGSGDNVTFTERLGFDPRAMPTTTSPGKDVTHWFELSVAPWYGMSICDPQSEPQLPCTPESDANAPHGRYPGGGAAFLELQFYPPGFAPFVDNISCDNTHWCAALTIDSLECTASGQCNNNCVEPVNFAFIQTNGVPTGPPSPQLANLATFTPNKYTLMMNPGDLIRTHMFDADIGGGQHALEASITDLTTGQRGWEIASGANGWMNTSIGNCSGTPFNFQPLYSSARAANSDTWSVLLSGILSEYETGHFEACTRVRKPQTFTDGSFSDTFWTYCHGVYENAAPADGTTGNQEVADAFCYPKGDTHGGTTPPNEVTGCLDDVYQNGDLDFDGSPYYADWPDSLTPGPFPSPLLQMEPSTVGGASYPQLQFETDVPASELNTCVPGHLSGCAVPPPGAPGNFYPYWTQATVHGQCVWEFGNMTNGNTFGGDAQYAHLVEHGFFPNQYDLASNPRSNPHC